MTFISTITADAVVAAATEIIKRSGSAARAEAWYAFVKATDPQEAKLTAEHIKLFDAQEKDVQKNMAKRPLKSIVDKGEFDSRIDSWLFGQRKWNKLFAEGTRDTIGGIVTLNGGRAMDEVTGVAAAFNVTDPNVREFVKAQPAEWGSLVNETTSKDLRRTLTTGMTAGESMAQLKTRVSDYYDLNAKDVRAPMIARTETTGAANFATEEGYRQTGVVSEKEWVATLDSRVRDTHAATDGETVPLGDKFSIGLEYPGDPSGDISTIINCRCTMIPVIDEDA